MSTNVKPSEQVIRPIFSILIAVAVLLLPQLPPWLALVAIYPFFTALIGWDPFYAAISALRQGLHTSGAHHHMQQGVTR